VSVQAVDTGWLGTRLNPRRVGLAGIVLGLAACWIALPPVTARSVVWSLLIALFAALCGAWAIRAGQRRVGWGAVAAAVLGTTGGILATQAGTSNLDVVFIWSALLAATLRWATPLTFAAIGGMFSERSGVVNIGLEGMMLMGAFWGIWAADKLGNWILGLVVAAVAGGLLALVHAFFSIHLRADQIVSGTAVNFLALGITGYAFIDIYGDAGTPSGISQIPDVHLGFADDTPLVGGIAQLNLMIWLSILVLVASYVFLFRTPWGLRLRSVGEHPRAADTVGINVYAIRYGAVVLSGTLAALGGAYLSMGQVHSFNQNMTVGRGFIALAALIFGKWRPFGAFGAALLFGFSTALAFQLSNVQAWESSSILFRTIPYVVTLVAVAGVIGRSIPPAAVGRPYKKQ
jgi:general nucleoside transport system permease protein